MFVLWNSFRFVSLFLLINKIILCIFTLICLFVFVFTLSVHFVVYCQSLKNLINILKYKYERSAIRFNLFALNMKYCGCVVAHIIKYDNSTLGTQLHVRIIIKSSWKIHNVLSSPHLQDTFDNAYSVNLNINHQD